MLLQLCEKDLLDLEKLLSLGVRSCNQIDDPRLSSITLRHVLSHTSGLPIANFKKGEWLKIESEPGSQFAYFRESFRYLDRVLEHITGVSLPTYMRESIFQQLNMNFSSFIWEERYAGQAASPHNREGFPTEKMEACSSCCFI